MKKLILLPMLLLTAAQPLFAMEGSSANNSEIVQDPSIPIKGYAPFNAVPAEMIKEIFSHLSADDIYNKTVLTCKQFLQIVKQQNSLKCRQPEEKEVINKFVQVIKTCGVDKAIQFNIQIQLIYDLFMLCHKIDNHQLANNIKKELMNFILEDSKQAAAKQFNPTEIQLIEQYQNELRNISFEDHDLFTMVLDNFAMSDIRKIDNLELANYIARIFINCAPIFNMSLYFRLYDEFINNSKERHLDMTYIIQASGDISSNNTKWKLNHYQPTTSTNPCIIQ